MVNQWRAIASLWELEARSHLMTTGVGDIGTMYSNYISGRVHWLARGVATRHPAAWFHDARNTP